MQETTETEATAATPATAETTAIPAKAAPAPIPVSDTMRAKIFEFIQLSGGDLEAAAEEGSKRFRSGYEMCFGEKIPEGPKKACAMVEETLRKNLPGLHDAIVQAHARFLSEEELDVVLSFLNNPVIKGWVSKAPSLQSELNEVKTVWQNDTLKTLEGALASVLA